MASKVVAKLCVLKSSFDISKSTSTGDESLDLLAERRVGGITAKITFHPMRKGKRTSRGRFIELGRSKDYSCTMFGCSSRRMRKAIPLSELKLGAGGECAIGRL